MGTPEVEQPPAVTCESFGADRLDAVVIGGGPGGYVCALAIAQAGGSVALVEEGDLGGTCTNSGCIPTKALLRSVKALDTKKAARFGVLMENIQMDWPKAHKRKAKVVATSRKGIESLLKSAGVELIQARGVIKAPGIVSAGSRILESRAIVIATGSRPAAIPGFECDGKRVLSSTHILELTEVPQSLAIIGGGTVGLEFGYMFRALGAKVNIVEMLPRVAPMEDPEISDFIARTLTRSGIGVHVCAKAIGLNESGLEIRTCDDQLQMLPASQVLVAAGRIPVFDPGQMDALGILHSPSGIQTNEKLETSVAGIYAIGDVRGPPLLAHAASAEGLVAAENIMGQDVDMVWDAIPACTFTTPEIASVGLTEEKALEKYGQNRIKVGRFQLAGSAKARCDEATQGLFKVIASSDDSTILGIHMVGVGVAELSAAAAIMVKTRMSVHELHSLAFAHPTLSEALIEAALDAFGMALHLPKKTE